MLDVMTPAESPAARSKIDLEAIVKQHGGSVFQSDAARKHMIIIADKGIISACDTNDV